MKKIAFGFLLVLGCLNFSFGAKLSFQSVKSVLIENCPAKIDVMLDTEGAMTTAMDLRIVADSLSGGSVTFVGFDGEGGLFKAFTLPTFSQVPYGILAGKTMIYSLLSTLSRWGVSGSGKLGTLLVTPGTGSSALSLQFLMTPNTDTEDSNVIVVSGTQTYDVLNKADSLYLPVTRGVCLSEEQLAAVDLQQKMASLAQNTSGMVLVSNRGFSSPFRFQELSDAISLFFVMHHFFIVVLSICLGVGILLFLFFVVRRRILSKK